MLDMTVVSVLVENLETASEALGMWLPVAMEEVDPLVRDWASAFVVALEVVSLTVDANTHIACDRSWLAGY